MRLIKAMKAGVLILFILAWAARLFPQSEWVKKAEPVLNVGVPGSWDEMLSVANSIMFHDGIYKMWYQGDNSFGLATSPDGIAWTKDHLNNPILEPGPPGSWDEIAVNQASVVLKDTVWHLWYSGVDEAYDNRIGHATSPDGILWTKDTLNPVLDIGTVNPWDSSEVLHPYVICENDTFRMWYNGYGSGTQRILYAWSTDGSAWTRYTDHPMLEPGPPGSWDSYELGPLSVVHLDTIYHMWYTAWSNAFDFQIGHATSPDGFFWTKDTANPVLKRGAPGSWDAAMIAIPVVLSESDTFKMWYGGSDYFHFRTGYAMSAQVATGIQPGAGQPLPVADNYFLGQNYPNPFNPVTRIPFRVAAGGFVTLKIYDVLGREVALLVNEWRSAGKYTVTWEAANLPAGIYFCRMEAAGFNRIRKMLLVK
ncbi:MAG: T9SS type A sorting domain-containing protein [Calditrichia bacterium]